MVWGPSIVAAVGGSSTDMDYTYSRFLVSVAADALIRYQGWGRKQAQSVLPDHLPIFAMYSGHMYTTEVAMIVAASNSVAPIDSFTA